MLVLVLMPVLMLVRAPSVSGHGGELQGELQGGPSPLFFVFFLFWEERCGKYGDMKT